MLRSDLLPRGRLLERRDPPRVSCDISNTRLTFIVRFVFYICDEFGAKRKGLAKHSIDIRDYRHISCSSTEWSLPADRLPRQRPLNH